MPRTSATPALTSPTAEELLASYNAISPTKRRRKFRTIEEAQAAIAALQPPPPAVQATRDVDDVKAREADKVIQIITDVNPYREGSAANRHFEAMHGGITILDYLAKFPAEEQRTARQWLWNARKKGHVKTVG